MLSNDGEDDELIGRLLEKRTKLEYLYKCVVTTPMVFSIALLISVARVQNLDYPYHAQLRNTFHEMITRVKGKYGYRP